MGVENTGDVVACGMHRAVNDEPRLIDRVLAALDKIAVEVDFDQARGSDFAEMQPVRIDEEMVIPSWNARRDMGEDEIVHAEMRDQPIAGGELDSDLLFR